MKKSVALLSVVACAAVVSYPVLSKAETADEQLLHRLEAKIDALAKENAALRARVKRVEVSSRQAVAAPHTAAAPKTSTTGANTVPTISAAALRANAAYMPVKSAAPVVPASGCGRFGGAYVGVNGGFTGRDSSWVDRDAWVDNFSQDWALGTVNNTNPGGTVGGQIGYNWQMGCVLFGVELDANWASDSWNKSYAPNANGATTLALSSKLDWFGTARTRTGLIVDNLLLYVTGGFAFAQIENKFTVTDTNIPTIESFSADKGRWGGVVGIGTEWAWAQNWSLKSEVLYLRFQEVTTTVFSANGNQTVHFDNQDAMWVGRMGVNYRW